MKKLVLIFVSLIILCNNMYGDSYKELPKNQQEVWNYDKIEISQIIEDKKGSIIIVVPLTNLGPNLPQYDELPDHRHTMILRNLTTYYDGTMYSGKIIKTKNLNFHVIGIYTSNNGIALPVVELIKK